VYGEAQYLHGHRLNRYWSDACTGRLLTWEEAQTHPTARKTRMWNRLHPIWTNPHSLGPLLQILDDRVTRVTCMSTRRQSYYLEQLPLPDVEVALLHTERDSLLRITTGFVVPTAMPRHWYHLLGTKGEVETGRRLGENGQAIGGLMWLADHHMRSRAEIDWGFDDYHLPPSDAPLAGHGGGDFFAAEDFVRSILDDRQPIVDVYRAAELAGTAIVSGMSAEQEGAPLPVPTFRPGERLAGQMPAAANA
jgi:hypothetical protein